MKKKCFNKNKAESDRTNKQKEEKICLHLIFIKLLLNNLEYFLCALKLKKNITGVTSSLLGSVFFLFFGFDHYQYYPTLY